MLGCVLCARAEHQTASSSNAIGFAVVASARPGVAAGEVFIPGLSESSGDDVEEGEVRDSEAPAPRAATLAGAAAGSISIGHAHCLDGSCGYASRGAAGTYRLPTKDVFGEARLRAFSGPKIAPVMVSSARYMWSSSRVVGCKQRRSR